MVKKTINALACTLIAPLAFAQMSTITTETPATNTEDTVTTYEPGKVIVVGSEGRHDSFSYVLDKTVRYVDKAGKEIDERLIKPGTRVHVYFDRTGETRVIDRVVVDED
jgi:hypothetical protein